jgi:serine/threonine protein kinase
MAFDDQSRTKPSSDDQATSQFSTPSNVQAGALLNGRYRLIRRLSQGGFGAVHLAHDLQMHDRPVVVKIQIDQRVDDPWFERKFSEEVRALSMIDHPGVVVAFDSGRTPDGLPFLVMQYVDGVTLRNVMDPAGMPLDRVAEIAKQIGHALGAAHDRGIWHRDLKPENLMLQSAAGMNDRVRLIDFGISTVSDLKTKYQTSTRVSGTVLYMAPDQAMGQPSAAADIYAMGLIVYEMVTGRRPFVADNAYQLAQLQRSAPRVKPSALRPALPMAAEQLILKSLQYEPSKRPANARIFGDQLYDAILNSTAPQLQRQPAVGRGIRGMKVAALVAAAVIVLAGASYYEFRTLHGRSNAPSTPAKAGTQPTVAPRLPAAQSPASKPEVPPVKVNDDPATELAYWNAVKDSSEPALYQDYLNTYPHGSFASLARTKLELLKQKSRKAAVQGRPEKGDRPERPEKPEGSVDIPDLKNFPIFLPNMAEMNAWNAIKDAKTAKPYQDFLAKYPHGMLAGAARAKIHSIENPRAAPDPEDSDK